MPPRAKRGVPARLCLSRPATAGGAGFARRFSPPRRRRFRAELEGKGGNRLHSQLSLCLVSATRYYCASRHCWPQTGPRPILAPLVLVRSLTALANSSQCRWAASGLWARPKPELGTLEGSMGLQRPIRGDSSKEFEPKLDERRSRGLAPPISSWIIPHKAVLHGVLYGNRREVGYWAKSPKAFRPAASP